MICNNAVAQGEKKERRERKIIMRQVVPLQVISLVSVRDLEVDLVNYARRVFDFDIRLFSPDHLPMWGTAIRSDLLCKKQFRSRTGKAR